MGYPTLPSVKTWRWRRLAMALAVIVMVAGSAAAFTELAEDIWRRQTFAWDVPFMLAVHQYSRPWLDVTMWGITQSGQSIAIVLVVMLAAWFWWRQQRLNAATLLGGFAGAVGLNTVLKFEFGRPRPNVFPPLVVEHSYSFPSGHAVAAMALYGMLAVILWRQRHRSWAVLLGAWILVVGLSRVYLGVHYPSDVLGGWSLGVLWLFAVFAIRDGYERRAANPLV